MYSSKKEDKNYLYEWIKCPKILLHLLAIGDICIDTLDIIHSPGKTLLDCLAFKKEELSDGEREIALFVFDRKNRMFQKNLWGFDFLKSAKEVGSPNEEFFIKAIEILFRPKEVIMPVLKWNTLQKPNLRHHTVDTILSYLYKHEYSPENRENIRIVFDKQLLHHTRKYMEEGYYRHRFANPAA